MSVLLDSAATRLFVANQLRQRSVGFTTATSRLSSGVGVQRAVDDVAAFSVGSRLALQARGWNTGLQNVQLGLSLLQTADDATQSLDNVLGRLRELATRAASGTWDGDARAAMHEEAKALLGSVFDTVEGTAFNGVQILGGEAVPAASSVDVTGFTATGTVGSDTQTSPLAGYPITITQAAGTASVSGIQPASTIPGPGSEVITIVGPAGTANVTLAPGLTAAACVALLNDPLVTGATGVTAGVDLDGFLTFSTTLVGSGAQVSIQTLNTVSSTGFTSTWRHGTGTDMQGTINGAPFTAAGNTITATVGAGPAAGLQIAFDVFPPAGSSGIAHVFVGDHVYEALGLQIQYAPNTGDEHLIDLPSFRSGYFDRDVPGTLEDVDLSTQAGALAALDVIDGAQAQLAEGRTHIGAQAATLEHEVTLASIGGVTQTTASAQILDADVAREATNLAAAQVLTEAGISALSALQGEAASMAELVRTMLSIGADVPRVALPGAAGAA